RTEGMYIQKIDNGFVTIDTRYESCSYDIYDCKGEKTKHVNIPMKKLEGEDLEFSPYEEIPSIELTTLCISADGKKAVYYGDNGLCTNSVELDDETVIQEIEELSEGFDKFYQMTRCLKYVDDTIYGEAAKYNSETGENEFFFASLDTKTKEWTVYCRLDRQWIFMKGDFVDNSFITPYADAYYGFSDRKLPYLLVGDKELRKFTCEEGDESTNAFISPNGKYILTTREQTFGDAEIKLYDVKTGEVLLKQKTSHSALGAYIDENERKLYVVCGTEFSVFDF
ncbi:MAG: hypothetical protein IKT78_01605, partial [Ruminiclostridium sp.]|nr:hypothetical protein [Ruminiclostridium sp.]